MNSDNEDIDSREGHLQIVARAKGKRNSQIFESDDESSCDDDRAPIRTLMKRSSQIITSDDETSCDDMAPINTLVRSRIDSVDEVKEDSSRRNLKSAKTKRPGEISDDDETNNGDSVPKSAIKTRYRSKSTTGFQYGVQEGARKRRLTRLRKSEIKNEQDDENSFDLKKSVCLKEISSSDDKEDNDALEDEEDDNSVENDGDYEGLEDEEDSDGPEDEEDFDDEQDEEDSDDTEDEEDFDGEQDEEDDDGDSTNKSKNAIIDSEGNLGIVSSAKRKRTSQIITSDDETSCDDTAPISTLIRSRIDSEDEVKGNASRQSLRSAKTKRAGKISDDDETSYEDNVPKSTIKTRYRSKCTTGFQDARKRRLRSLRKPEIENEQDDMNSSDLKNSTFLKESSSSDDEGDNDALEDEEDYDGEEDKEDNESVEEDDDGDSYDAMNDSEPDMDMSEVYSPDTISAKMKRVTQIIVSDAEISYDDNSPTTTLRTQHNTTFSTDYEDEVKDDESKQSPTKLTKSESENEQEDESSCDLNQTSRLDAHSSGNDEDNDGQEEGSTSECDTLDGFIVKDEKDELNDADKHDFEEILGHLERQNISKQKWGLEGDMLADFGKNTELCMRAVCVLYRQQTADEKSAKETRYRNGRGFSQVDADRGCKLAEFLTDGDPAGILKKTVEELEQHNFEWIELCNALAMKYAKQLFQIYKNKEDPYFPE